MVNGQNTDLNNEMYSSGTPKKPEKGRNMPTRRTNFYVQEYRDIT